MSATVTSIEITARRKGSSQRPSLRPRLIFSPEPNSESSTTISAMRSSALLCETSATCVQSSQSGLTAAPTAR